MFHFGRCGSTVLANLIQQHDRVFWDGEIYDRHALSWRATWDKTCNLAEPDAAHAENLFDQPIRVLRRRLHLAGARFYGHEVKFVHLRCATTGLANYLQALFDLDFMYFVSLKRQNYLKRIVSAMIAWETKSYHISPLTKPELRHTKIDLNAIGTMMGSKPLLETFAEWDRDYEEFARLVAGHPLLELTYENDIANDPMDAYRKMCRFLGLDPRPVKVREGKTNPFTLREQIVNSDEVAEALTGTPHEWMLDGDAGPGPVNTAPYQARDRSP